MEFRRRESCAVRLIERGSQAPCIRYNSFDCSMSDGEPLITVWASCRGIFELEGKVVQCGSYRYPQERCKAPLVPLKPPRGWRTEAQSGMVNATSDQNCRLIERRSRAPCTRFSSFDCKLPADGGESSITVWASCRGIFELEGKVVQCGSYRYPQERCTAPLVPQLSPLRIRELRRRNYWRPAGGLAELSCYAERYPDLLGGYCSGMLERCRWSGLKQHWLANGTREQRIFGCLAPPKRAAATMSPTLPLSKNNVRQCPASWQRLQAKLGTANDFMSASPPPPGPGMRLASCGVASAAIYFPGFHRSVENDRFWGKGWTEWDNIRNLTWDPLALARVAHPMRYYDTADGGATIREQAKKAREAGLKAFMFYHYYFGSGRTSLNKPIEDAVIRGKGLGIHFFFSWSDQPLPHCQTHCQTLAVP